METRKCDPRTNIEKEETKTIGQGSRTEFAETCDRIIKGAKIKTIAVEFSTSFVKYARGFQQLNLLLLYGKKETLSLLSCGCVARLATVNPEVRETFPTQVKTLIGGCTTNQKVPAGLLAIREMKLLYGMTHQRTPPLHYYYKYSIEMN